MMITMMIRRIILSIIKEKGERVMNERLSLYLIKTISPNVELSGQSGVTLLDDLLKNQ